MNIGFEEDLGGRFVLRAPVGAGGMATVYRAFDRRTGRAVALKRLHRSNPGMIARFALEIDALGTLDHPAIVRLIAHGKWSDGHPCLAMEWLEGEDLSARLERGALDPRQVVSLGMRVASALAKAHSHGIVHRDIKPANLFLPNKSIEQIKVIDFGIARLSGRAPITGAGNVVGTPGYMAPEQATGDATIDARADIFSLGAVLYECLTGIPPFVAEHTIAVLARILHEEIPTAARVRPGVPGALSDLIARMLSKSRHERPKSAGALLKTLETMSHEAGGWTRMPPRPPSTPSAKERRFTTVVVVQPITTQDAPTEPTQNEQLCSEVAALGARIDTLMNGAQLITWSGSEDPSEQAARAARCALRAREIVPDRAIVLSSGFSESKEPRAVFRALDHAAALLTAEETLPNRGIRLDSNTAGLLDPRFHILESPVGWTLTAERESGAGARTLLGRPSPYLGRMRELRALEGGVDACIQDQMAQAMLVTAPAGMGKSRLVYELCANLERRFSAESLWLGRGDCMSAGSAFMTLGSTLRSTAGTGGRDSLPERRQKLAARVAKAVPEPERDRITAFLGELAGIPFPEGHCESLASARATAAVMADQIRQAWLDFVSAELSAHPVLIIVDDLHWGDMPSVDLLDRTLRELSDRPLFVLGLARPEVHDTFPKLWTQRGLHEIRLNGLSPAAAEELVRKMLGGSLDMAIVAKIITRAEGNAFYLEEMIRAVADGRTEALPDTVLAMVQARLDVLSLGERTILRAASVLGETFWQRGTEALLEGSSHQSQVAACLNTLLAKEILTPSRGSRFPGERELSFRHALLRDGAYAQLTEPDRQAAHHRAAEWLLDVGEDDPVMLAEHFEQGGVIERAIPYRIAAAQRAFAGNDPRAATLHAARCPAGSMTREMRILRAQVLTEAHWFSGDIERADAYADELFELVATGTEPWCTAIGTKMMLALMRGRLDTMLSIVASFMTTPLPDPCLKGLTRVYTVLSMLTSFTGLKGPAAYFLDMAHRAAPEDAPDPLTDWYLHTARAMLRFFLEGDLGGALDDYRRALTFSKRAGMLQIDMFNDGLMGWIYYALGAFKLVEHHARRAMDSTEPHSHAGLFGRLLLSWLCTYRGSFAEGRRLAESAIELGEGQIFMQGMAESALGYVLFSAGEPEEAARAVEASLDLLTPSPLLRSLPIVQLAEIELSRGHAAAALAMLEPVLDTDSPTPAHPGSRIYAWSVEIEAREALGDSDGVRAALLKARDRILDLANTLSDSQLRDSLLEASPWASALVKRANALEEASESRSIA